MLFVDKATKMGIVVIGLLILFSISILTIMFELVMGPFEDVINHILSDIIVNLLGLLGIHIIPLDSLFSKMESVISALFPLEIIGLIIIFILIVKAKIGRIF